MALFLLLLLHSSFITFPAIYCHTVRGEHVCMSHRMQQQHHTAASPKANKIYCISEMVELSAEKLRFGPFYVTITVPA